MVLRRYMLFLSKKSNVDVKKKQGINGDYVLELDDTEIKLPEEKLYELHKKIEGVLYEKENN